MPNATTELQKIATARLPTSAGEFTSHAFLNPQTGVEHLVLTLGDIAGDDVLIRLHSECLTGDALGSLRCDCGEQLQNALKQIQAQGRGALVYLRGHEGRGIGLCNKIYAYQLQDQGMDTVEANLAQGLPSDGRNYEDAAAMLKMLGIKSVRLMSNNPLKIDALNELGIPVTERLAHEVVANPENKKYLQTKKERMGHLLSTRGKK
ncbi:GTP cyclohydrolase II [Chitinibacter sp. SCUT-21]|uniref:GTP cyclohydrolase II n=1 Tax=Chitinibacter sp. SCUT-21 TaxID=2970891 RepID=UPI0035A613E4